MASTLQEVARWLAVPERTVARWIRERGLPAHRVQDRFSFNRTEVLEWATALGVPLDPQMAGSGREDGIPLADALEAGGIQQGVGGHDPASVLRSVVEGMSLAPADRMSLLDVFLSREDFGTTPLGEGFAIPHVRSPIILGVDRPHATLSYLDRPVDFKALDGRPVHTLFTLISPTVRAHLALLSTLASALQDPRFKDCVLRRGGREEILAEARRLGNPASPEEA